MSVIKVDFIQTVFNVLFENNYLGKFLTDGIFTFKHSLLIYFNIYNFYVFILWIVFKNFILIYCIFWQQTILEIYFSNSYIFKYIHFVRIPKYRYEKTCENNFYILNTVGKYAELENIYYNNT